MPISVLLAKIAGAALLGWTVYSIVKHLRECKTAEYQQKQKEQASSERFLNNALLYLWLAFMVVFSSGLIINN